MTTRRDHPAGSVGASNAAASAELGLSKARAPRKPRAEDPWLDELRQSGEIGVEWTAKQRLFASAYLRHRVGSRAVREAGYDVENPDRAAEIAKQILKVRHVRAYINERSQELLTRYEAGAEQVIEELASIAFSNLGDYVSPTDDGNAVLDLRDLTDKQWKALGQIETIATPVLDELGKEQVDPVTGRKIVTLKTTIKPVDKLKALEALGRHHRLFTDKLEVSGSVDIAGRIKAARDAMRAKREEANGTESVE